MTQSEKIILTASKLFMNYSVKAITMDMVAKEMGISKRTIYENFQDKKDLVKACINHIIEIQEQKNLEIITQCNNIVDELLAMFESIDRDFMKMGRFSYDIQRLYPDIFEHTFAHHRKLSSQRLREQLERGVEQKIILSDINIDLSILSINETLNNLFMKSPEQVINANADMTQAFKYVLIYFFRGIATYEGIQLIDKKLMQKKQTTANTL